MACSNCKEVKNNSRTLIPSSKCNDPCAELICPVGEIQSGCITVDVPLSCIDSEVNDNLTDVLASLDEKICSCCSTPSGNPSLSGVIYNSNSAARIQQVTTAQVLKSFNNNYIASSQITTNDIIEVSFTGRFYRQSDEADLTLKITIANGASVIKDILIPVELIDVLFPYNATLSINLTSASSALVTGVLVIGDDNSYSGFSQPADNSSGFYSRLTGLNFSNLTISVNFIMADVGNINDGYVDSLVVEVKKKI